MTTGSTLQRLVTRPGTVSGRVLTVTPQTVEVAAGESRLSFPWQAGLRPGDRVTIVDGRLIPPSRREVRRYEV